MELAIRVVRILAMVTADVWFPIVDFLRVCVMSDSLVSRAMCLHVITIAAEMEFVLMDRAYAIPNFMVVIVL